MKLQIVPARRGIHWVKAGVKTFFRQPLALSGLFFMFLALVSVISIVPVVGNVLSLALLPAATLGLMAATREADNGKFPMPVLLISAFRAGRQQMRAMSVLGALYAAGFVLILAFSALIDGGKCARLYLMGAPITSEMLQEGDFQLAILVVSALYLPLSLLFWHAPALVHWHGLPPVKSLFFSLVACLRNIRAFMVFGLAWTGMFLIFGIIMAMLGAMMGSAEAVAAMLYPAVMLVLAMFFTSIYFTFRDSFEFPTGEDA
ncbi:BPSS1780 family membrane protein [Candidatus Aalborgicola defluviihabitans]|uniref:BPSS1780 family membrane protein n=1 Tax=Candidatus Aalborgicola defluviihabitans TaxID=3386187 RepID=UPI001ED610B0|nr:hypothetical protein [Burkholderiales bacterium]MBK7281215.1 hypothetical protein [Burkholderiales bacterium]